MRSMTIPDEGLAHLQELRHVGDRQELTVDVLLALLGIPPVMGGAELFPDEGLDHVLNKVPIAGVAIQTSYGLGLFTSQTASTVPARTVTLASQTGITEVPNSGAYARVSVANSDWGAIATSGSGRKTTSAQKTFPDSTGSWGTINGFFVATNTTWGLGVALFYANFDDVTAINVNAAGFTVRVTPYVQYDG